MREIKFRAWHIVDNAWLSSNELKQYISFQPDRELLVPTNVKLMQYTGLKDKNGKEIYEGDILIPGWTKDEVFIVVYDEKHARFSEKRSKNNLLRDGSLLTSKYNPREIIGNIYENPELLKEEKK